MLVPPIRLDNLRAPIPRALLGLLKPRRWRWVFGSVQNTGQKKNDQRRDIAGARGSKRRTKSFVDSVPRGKAIYGEHRFTRTWATDCSWRKRRELARFDTRELESELGSAASSGG